MENNIHIDTFPITEDMYQLKSIDIINSNFLSIKKWHDAFDDFCKLNTEAGLTRLYIEKATSIESDDVKTDHIMSKAVYEPSGTVQNDADSPMFEISGTAFRYKGFIIDADGIHLPLECAVAVKDDHDLEVLNADLAIPGKYANMFIRIILNATSQDIEIQNIGNNEARTLGPRESITIMHYEGFWYAL